LLFLYSRFHFFFDPGTSQGVFGQQQQELFLQMDSLVDASADLITDLHILWREPATDTIGLEICIQTASKRVVLAGVANEHRVILDRMHHSGPPEVNPFVRYTCAMEKMEGAAILRKVQRV